MCVCVKGVEPWAQRALAVLCPFAAANATVARHIHGPLAAFRPENYKMLSHRERERESSLPLTSHILASHAKFLHLPKTF